VELEALHMVVEEEAVAQGMELEQEEAWLGMALGMASASGSQ